jgi:hypothetical protein
MPLYDSDVANISKFATLNQRCEDLAAELRRVKVQFSARDLPKANALYQEEKETCDDAVMELELTDEDELIP